MWETWNARVEALLMKLFGPPAPFQKMLVAWLCLMVSGYIWAFRGVEPSPISILNGAMLLALGMAALFAGVGLVLLASLDATRHAPFKEKFLAFATLVLGFFLFDALQQLAIEDRAMFLETS